MLEIVRLLASSPWLWAAVFVIAALDALLPFMPSETTVVLVGVLIAPSAFGLGQLILVAAAGAFAGDTAAYFLGRSTGAAVLTRLMRRERGARAREWAQRQLERRGRLLIVFGRYVPGGRAATLATAGALGFSPSWFLPPEVAGVLLWGTQAALVGFVGGTAFQDEPLTGMAVSYGFIVLVVIGTAVVHRLRRPHNGVERAQRLLDALDGD
ncbi:DedA family protein [Kutzneria kofuensis]|uniref:Membrane protein DedA with SNARE-associated domain n=1 Tax=Kutzneria kofuensis TaxID=103725 RepID=A0A7W9NGU4_9PSEU|nr:VTT domain-containing protein [Kutzneria kofuensis]MBB5892867.1 membrane protein DedA with SNARE-associated domain [Kutzneria kofuensis]